MTTSLLRDERHENPVPPCMFLIAMEFGWPETIIARAGNVNANVPFRGWTVDGVM